MNMLEMLYVEVKSIKGEINDLKQSQGRMESKIDSIQKHLIEISKNWNEIATLKAVK